MRQVDHATTSLWLVIVGSLLLAPPTAKGDFVFGEPTKVPNLNSSSAEISPSISADGLELYFASNDQHGADLSYHDIWVTTRTSTDEPWGVPRNLGSPVNTPSGAEVNPSISADGLELYFSDSWPSYVHEWNLRSGGYGKGDIWVSKRETREANWGEPVNLGPQINSDSYDGTPHLSADGLSLYFGSNRSPDVESDLYVSTRPTKDDPWGPAVALGAPINTMAEQDFLFYPFLSYDGLSLFFTAIPWPWGSAGGLSNGDIFVSTRPNRDDGWGVPLRLPVLSSTRNDGGLTFAHGDSTLYFGRSDPYIASPSFVEDPARATGDIWQVEVSPIVDFNGDGRVDGADVLILASRWEQNDSACDIAPFPIGDKIVDLQDLNALAGYIGEDITDITLVAHWPLDEVEGNVAHDTVGDNDGTVFGEALWRPEAGQMDGALELDGATCVTVDFVLDPSEGPFSALAWIKGGAPGQGILSQVHGQNWLKVDAAGGTLATALGPPASRGPIPPLVSDTVITDGAWHRIGVVWDGTSRALYVDDVLVAEEIREAPLDCLGGLNIGCGNEATPGTFFTGLIDDFRIYNRAVRP